MEIKVSTAIGMLIIFAVILPTAWICYHQWLGLVSASENINFQVPLIESKNEITKSEKDQINNWIVENNLNQYGDPKNTVYAGGSPLFDEKTGQSLSKYEYIILKHPAHPWKIK